MNFVAMFQGRIGPPRSATRTSLHGTVLRGLCATCLLLLNTPHPARAQNFGSAQIGQLGVQGKISRGNSKNSFLVEGGGVDIGGSFDNFTFHFLNTPGDFDWRVQILSLEPSSPSSKAGLMLRESLSNDSRMFYLRTTPEGNSPVGLPGDNDVRLQERLKAGAKDILMPPADGPIPLYPDAWLRLERHGDVVGAYFSHDGIQWDLLADGNAKGWLGGLPGQGGPFVGLAVGRGLNAVGDLTSAEFANLTTAGPFPPTISDVADQVIEQNGSSGPIAFQVADLDTAADKLAVAVASGDPKLLPNSGLILGGNLGQRTLTISPAADQSGNTQITLRVMDGATVVAKTINVLVNPPPSVFDFGDAPDKPYPTLRNSNGAAQRVLKGYSLGATVDGEPDGQPNAVATGDGTDEDGVSFAGQLVPGQDAFAQVVLTDTVHATPGGVLDVFVDFDGNGVWGDPGESFVFNLTKGTNLLSIAIPSDARLGTNFARFRLSRDGVGDPAGVSDQEGEIEDHQLMITAAPPIRDYGDAPDKPYPTLQSNNGASQIVSQKFLLGGKIDAEADGQPNADASGDDGDEDGVQFLTAFVPGQNAKIRISLLSSIGSGKLDAWMDWDADGKWSGPGEHILDTFVSPGATDFDVVVPLNATPGSTFARFRLSQKGPVDFLGPSDQLGEVEDYEVTVSEPARLDFGDAPEKGTSYPTTLARDGARHRFNPDVFLGNRIDVESDGQPDSGALGDDNQPNPALNDEDGVSFLSPIKAGSTAIVLVTASTRGRLDAWIDFDQNGSWAEPADRIFNNLLIGSGSNTLTFQVPASAREGSTFARFRFSLTGVPSFDGLATSGEVEDYQVKVTTGEQFDYGDAPDQPYPTLQAHNGASQRVNPQFVLGRTIDAEPDGQPSAGAIGDGSDEDGVQFLTPFVPGELVTVRVTLSSSIGKGQLDAWIDFNGDGDWLDADEHVIGGVQPVGIKDWQFPVPFSAKPGRTFARFRLSQEGNVESFGPSTQSGEVEDYEIRITPADQFDFGDAPEDQNVLAAGGGGYPTTLARNGARHRIVSGFYLGQRVDGEPDGQPTAGSNGDDFNPIGADDEDGVRFLGALVPGHVASVEVVASAQGLLDAWVDFAQNRNWTDGGDQIFNGQPLVAGTNVLSFMVPSDALAGSTYTRFRLSRKGGLAPTGLAEDGEVEDHRVRVLQERCDLSCMGRDFWLTFPGNYAPDPANPPVPQLCVLGDPGALVTVDIPSLGFNPTSPIPPSGLLNVTLPRAADLADLNDLVTNRGVHVTATDSISVHALDQVQFSSDGYLALPTEVLGTSYIVVGYSNVFGAVPELNGSQFALVATEDDTTVSITPSAVVGSHDAGFSYSISLKSGDVYQLVETNGSPADLTGTLITSDKPIGVYGSHGCASIRSPTTFFCDYLVEQLLPVNRWSAEYYTHSLATRSNYTIRVVAAQSNTLAQVNGILVNISDRGGFIERSVTGPARILSSQPVMVIQYANSSDADDVENADPFMVTVPGRALYTSNQVFCTASTGFLKHYINVISPAAAVGSLRLDGVPPAAVFQPIPGTAFVCASILVTAGRHTLTASDPVGVIVYGWNKYESYAWPACLFFGDTTPPHIECPTNEIRRALSSDSANNTGGCTTPVPDLRRQARVSDNCDLGREFQVQQDPFPGTLVGVGTWPIKLTAADARGNVGLCVVSFVVTDLNPNGPYRLDCPTQINATCTTNNGAFVTYHVSLLKGCTVTSNEVLCLPRSGSFFAQGTNYVICRVPLENGQSLECTFPVIVECRRFLSVTPSFDHRVITLEWDESADMRLESSASPFGPWEPVPGAHSGQPLPIGLEISKFYRLNGVP